MSVESALRRRMMLMSCNADTKIYASRTLDNVQLSYQGILIMRNNEKVYQFELEVGKTYQISQKSETVGYCRARGWSTVELEIGGQSYKDDLTTIGCSTALGGTTFNNLNDLNRIFVARAKYLYAYNQNITTAFSDDEIYLDEMEA